MRRHRRVSPTGMDNPVLEMTDGPLSPVSMALFHLSVTLFKLYFPS